MSTILSEEVEKKLMGMLNRLKVFPVVGILILLAFFVLFFNGLAQQSVLAAQEYQLPYPGILPNHPLYAVKVIRDRAMEFFTRDPLKKAELYLLFADKRINMAQFVREQDWSLAETTASKAEKYLLELKDSLGNARQIGLQPTVSFIAKIKRASLEHRKILMKLQKAAPKNTAKGFTASLTLNSQFQDFVNGL